MNWAQVHWPKAKTHKRVGQRGERGETNTPENSNKHGLETGEDHYRDM